jgi:hypothetical protein
MSGRLAGRGGAGRAGAGPGRGGTRHKYIGAMSGSLVGLVSKTNIFLY